MKKVLMVGLMAVAVMLTGTMAAQAKGKAAKAPKAPLPEITVAGTVEQSQVGKKTVYKLTDADGSVVTLPAKDAAQYVGAKVTVTGQATTTTKKGTTTKSIKKVTKIEKADAAPVAPAAPAAPAK